jgi:hypothetical protein
MSEAAMEILLNTSVQISDGYVRNIEPATSPVTGAIGSEFATFTPPPYSSGTYLENTCNVACSQHIRGLFLFLQHLLQRFPYHLAVETMSGLEVYPNQ